MQNKYEDVELPSVKATGTLGAATDASGSAVAVYGDALPRARDHDASGMGTPLAQVES